MSFHNKFVGIRLKEEYWEALKEIVNDDNDKYFNYSHFIRCAVIKLIREELNSKT